MTTPSAIDRLRNTAWTWWTSLALCGLYLIISGPRRSPFSGVPFSSKATALFIAFVAVAIFAALFRPYRRPRAAWAIAILALVVIKLILSMLTVVPGWKGEYRTAIRIDGERFTAMAVQYFQNRGFASQPYRFDRDIDFSRDTWGLSYINEIPERPAVRVRVPARDADQPLHVHWTGYASLAAPRPIAITVSAAGRIIVSIDGRRAADAMDPDKLAILVPSSAGTHRIAIDYIKQAGVEPRTQVMVDAPVTVTPAGGNQLSRSAFAERATTILGVLSLLLLFGAAVDAYTPLRQLLLRDLWSRPDKLAAFALAAFFLYQGLFQSIPWRHHTIQLSVGDDPLIYERNGRWIARNGLMLVDDSGSGVPYFFYPLYSYGLAAAHILFGDDFSTVYLFNYICIAASTLLMWAILRKYLAHLSLVLLLIFVFKPFALDTYGWYARNAFSDNLFGPMVLAMLLVSAAAFERLNTRLFFWAGVLTALGAAARTSLMTHSAFVCLAILLYRELGDVRQRIRQCFVYAAGFLVALAPFTIRNWIVSKKFVLLVSSIVQMPNFLFVGDEKVPNLMINGRVATFTESVGQWIAIFMSDPAHYTWHEMKKVLFTLGFVQFGPPGVHAPDYIIYFPIAFAVALLAGRVRKAVAFALVAFCASHLTAMVMAAPWTYGYKTILPFIMATMAGGAFVLPALRERRSLRTTAVLDEPSVTAVMIGPVTAEAIEEVRAAIDPSEVIVAGGEEPAGTFAGAVQMPSLRRALEEATGDVIAVVPADNVYAPRDIRKLLMYAPECDAVFGRRSPRKGRSASLRASRLVAKAVALRGRSAEPLHDVRCAMWLVRRSAWELVRESTAASDDMLPLEMMILALRSGCNIVQVPVSYEPGSLVESVGWVLPALRAITRRRDARTASRPLTRDDRDLEGRPDAASVARAPGVIR